MLKKIILIGFIFSFTLSCSKALTDSYEAAKNTCMGVGSNPSWKTVGNAAFSPHASNISIIIADCVPYVAFSDNTTSPVNKATVMKYNGLNWVYVGNPGFTDGTIASTSSGCSLAYNNGTLYLAYQDGNVGKKLSVMKFDGTTWSYLGTQGFSSGASDYINLRFYNGTPYVGFKNGANVNVMKYTGIGATGWEEVGVLGANPTVYVAFEIDNGTPYVFFSDTGGLVQARVMKFNGTTWEDVGSQRFSAKDANFNSLAFFNGTPYVAYNDGGNGNEATVMKYTGTGLTGWVPVGSPGFTPAIANYTSLMFNQGIPYLAFSDWNQGPKTTVMKFNGSNWEYYGNAGFSPDSAEDTKISVSNGVIYVAYIERDTPYKITVMKYQ